MMKYMKRLIGMSKMQLALSQSYHGMPVVTENMDSVIVDLRSDTITKPTKKMRDAVSCAVVGDDVLAEDPTVRKLEEMMCDMFKKESALFIPSGTMGNLIAVMVHCNQRGSEIILGDRCHIFKYEQGGISQIAGVMPNLVNNYSDGTFSINDCISKIRESNIHYPITSAICIENTHNLCGGRVLPQQWIDELCVEAARHNLPVHMDGARIWNAHISSAIPLSRIVRNCSSCCVCLSKGLGAPIGSVLLGSSDFIFSARRMRKALGGGMRQVGIIAAAGIIAIEEMVTRLEEDHFRAESLASNINNCANEIAEVEYSETHTNILMVTLKIPSVVFARRLAMVSEEEKFVLGKNVKILCLPLLPDAVRFVTHCDLSAEQIEWANLKIKYLLTHPTEFQT